MTNENSIEELVKFHEERLLKGDSPAQDLFTLGMLHRDAGRTVKAESYLVQAIQRKPSHLKALLALAGIKQDDQQFDEAVRLYQAVLKLDTTHSHALNNMGNIARQFGDIDTALDFFSQAQLADPTNYVAFCNRMMSLHYASCFDHNKAKAMAQGAHWENVYEQPERRDREAAQPITIGYVSPDFVDHPVAIFLLPVLRSYSRKFFRVHCYSTSARVMDSYTAAIVDSVDLFRSVGKFDLEKLRATIRQDKVDILVDLSGHGAGNRLPLFSRRVAPVQISWLGYFGTTGIANMDYVLGDLVVSPSSEEERFCEKVIRLADSYLCFEPVAPYPEVSVLPCREYGFFTFGCFSNRVKIGPAVIDAWAEILRRVSKSKLLLKYHSYHSEKMKRAILKQFESRGIDPSRIQCEGRSSYYKYLESFNRVDLSLDTFPFTGGTTTAFSLWMGVPMLTISGDRWSGRISASVEISAGMGEYVCKDIAEYVERAVRIASESDHLENQRKLMRTTMMNSPLMDRSRFTLELEKIYSQMFENTLQK
jgi:protein O-GlcNAc transferase